MKRLFVFDIDGTVRTNTDHSIPESTLIALNKLRAQGDMLLVATGRSVDSLLHTHIYESFAFDGYVCNSGQALLDKELNVIKKYVMPDDVVKKALKAAKDHHIPLALKTTPRIITMEPNEDVKRAVKFFGNPLPEVGEYTGQEIGALIAYGPLGYKYEEFFAIEELDVMVGVSSYADIALRGLSKASGIKFFMDQWGFNEYVAFGDSLNDEEMFKHAAFSICLGQGDQQLKDMADYVTTPIDQDGVYNACVHLKYFKED